jgi:hypothetical protein
MVHRVRLALLLVLFACGDSEEAASEDEKLAGASKLTSDRAAQIGSYCCYENGALASDAPAACRASTASCFFSETYSDVSPAGRGTMCGYLLCGD